MNKPILDWAGTKWNNVYPELLDTEATSEECYSPQNFQDEVEKVFKRAWMFAAHVSDVPKNGSYTVKDFPAIKASIIITRGLDGEIRGFHNVCRHRCAKLRPGGEASAAVSIMCEFHGWTYDLDGKLIGMPDPDGRLQQDKLGLVPVATEVWNGFIFINLQKEPVQGLIEYLGGMATHPVNNYPFDQEWESWGWKVEVRANWKIVRDLFLEGYHIAFVHKDSVDSMYSDAENPFSHLPAIKYHGIHSATSSYGNPETRKTSGPVGDLSAKFGGMANSRFGKAHGSFPGLNPEKIPNWSIDAYGIFPYFHFHMFGGLWHYHTFEPIDVDHTIWVNRIFFPKARNAGERFAHEFSGSLQRAVSVEDVSAAERNYAGMETAAVPVLALHDQEITIRHFRQSLRRFMDSPDGRVA